MPRYFLHIRDGDDFVRDEEGAEYPDLLSAISEAVLGARDLLAEKLHAGEELDGQQIEICNERGDLLRVIRFRDTFEVAEDETRNVRVVDRLKYRDDLDGP